MAIKTVTTIERGDPASPGTTDAIRRFLERSGIVFEPDGSVIRSRDGTRIPPERKLGTGERMRRLREACGLVRAATIRSIERLDHLDGVREVNLVDMLVTLEARGCELG